ncbi:MAG: hypothetical protein H6506_04315 [Calditrichaeota bacterium]|nr:hypothetical protein [Calditrichota bacterium]MCB9366017.1 hypothetical protein [Calditrichota bacterium]MCB9391857.1 hypothetical protein [Calditrichota bacterium]
MRVENTRPYGIPLPPKEGNENVASRASKLPETATNSAGDLFELSSEQKVTQNVVAQVPDAADLPALTPERLAELRGKISTGYYLTPQAAEETAKALAEFHH